MDNESTFCQIRVKIGSQGESLAVRLEVLEEPLMASLLEQIPEDEADVWNLIANSVRDYKGLEHFSGIDTPFIRLQKQVEQLTEELKQLWEVLGQ
jgi:hypothetical protein